MIDTLHLWLKGDEVGNKTASSSHLIASEYRLKQTGEEYFSGKLSPHLWVSSSAKGTSIKGSLCKYYLGDNCQTLTRGDIERALQRLSDELNLPIDKAQVNRVDIADNMLVNYPVMSYFSYLGECRYLKRFRQPKTLYYQNGSRMLTIYDKLIESKKSGQVVPVFWNNSNVLRYEMRLIHKVAEQLNRDKLTASDLINEETYMMLVNRWYSEYNSIQKLQLINLDYRLMETPKDFMEQMAFLKIKELGQEKVIELVEDMRAKDIMKRPEYYSQVKGKVKKVFTTPQTSTPSQHITELDEKLNSVMKNYR